MMIIRSTLCYFIFILALLLILPSCSDPNTPELITADFVSTIEDAVEKKNRRTLKHLVSDHYLDTSNRSKRDVLAIANGYLLRNKSIYCFTKIDSVIQNEETEISVRILAALASKPIPDISMLPSIRSDIYWFDVTISQSGGSWQLTEASWKQAMLEDFL